MALATGTRVGPYEIINAIGAGGMGEVYRALDTRLDREVAIKILPQVFVADPDRLARFEREAKTLASLNHPNIAQIYGTESSGAIHALAMELVEGEDLARRITRGAIPIAEALPIAKQIADALEAAHERGIIHRDLKPANIRVRDDGTVKVLDFGLAKAVEGSGRGLPGTAMVNSPTFTSPVVTQIGVILGTAAYMSPEQAKGKAVDRGADMWAFGAVLYEMLTGVPPFQGETVTDVLAAIVLRDPAWTPLPAGTPPQIRRLLQRCLERDRRRRLADAGEARFQIEEALAAPAELPTLAPAVARGPARRPLIPWGIAALLAAVVLLLGVREWRRPAPEIARVNLELPLKAELSLASRPALAISPDGSTVVFVATVAGIDRLYVRRLGGFDITPIPSSEGGSHPVISPDGRAVAFVTNTRLVHVPIAGGPTVVLADVQDPRGLSWDEQDTIIYTPETVGGIRKIPAAGGAFSQLTTPVEATERTHRWPQLLPGGAVLFTVGSFGSPDSYDEATIEAQMPDGSRRVVLTAASMARYVPSGHLLFARTGTLFSVPFDPRKVELQGTPKPVLHEVAGDVTTGAAHFAVAASGSLLYIGAGNAQGSLLPMWVDRAGRTEPLPVPLGAHSDVRLSPDGQQVALTLVGGGGRDIWIHHFHRRTFTRITLSGQSFTPLWSGDGTMLYYVSVDRGGKSTTIMRRRSDGSSDPEPLVTLPDRVYINEIVDDGRAAIVDLVTGLGSQIAKVELKEGAKPVVFVPGGAYVYNGRLSPRGRWLAYVSAESGRSEVYVRSMAGDSARWTVSTAGGEEPKWSPDGRFLYYRYNNVLFGVAVAPRTDVFESGTPVPVVTGIYNLRTESGVSYDVERTGQRFLMTRLAGETTEAKSLRLVVNWINELR